MVRALRPRSAPRQIALVAACLALLGGIRAQAQVQSGFGAASGGGIAASRESYKTDLFTGSASLSIPINVPPGTNGAAPDLALTYNNGVGITWLGQGWDLRLPSVRRMVKFGVPKYDDDPLAGDRFELGNDQLVRDDAGGYRFTRDSFDRIQRLDDGSGRVLSWVLNRTDGSRLEFGADSQSRVTNPSGEVFEWLLTREVDSNGNFIEYTYYDRGTGELGTDMVPYPKGIIYGYRGDTSGSATIRSVDFIMQDRPDHSSSYRGAVHQRMFHRLDRIEVRAGDALVTAFDLKYYGEAGEGSVPANHRSLVRRVVRLGADNTTALPADVYTYSGGAAGTWTLSPTVSSNLANLRLPGLVWDGSAFVSEFDLRKVDLRNGNMFRVLDVNGDAVPDIVGTGASEYHQYGTFFNEGNAAVFPVTRPPRPDVLAYSPDFLGGFSGGHIVMPQILSPQYSIPMGSRVADLDGDGRPEVLTGAHEVTDDPSLFLSGYLAYFNVGFNWVLGAGWDPASGYNSPPAKLAVYQGRCWWVTRPILIGWTELVDVNGDGRADLLEHRTPGELADCATNGKAAWTERNVYLNNGNGWDAEPDPDWSAGFSAALTKLNVFVYQLLPVDVNGDGLPDLMADALPALCSGSCNNDGLPGTTSNNRENVNDFARGADGRADADPANPATAIVLINTGKGWASSPLDADVSIPAGFRPVDLNGDGLVDNATATPELNTGLGLVTAPFTLPNSFGSSTGGRIIADIDGDGQVDLVRADGGSNFQVLLSTSEPPPGLLTRQDLVTGGSIDLEYTASSEGSCFEDFDGGGCHERLVPWGTEPDGSYRHANDPLCVFPWRQPDDGTDRCQFVFQDLPFPVQTVTRVISDDRNGNVTVSEAEYNFGRFNNALEPTRDREFRGFGLTSKFSPTTTYTDPKTSQTVRFSTLEETEFYQEAFLRGQPARSVRYQIGDPSVLANRNDRTRVLDIRVPVFGFAHGASESWSLFAWLLGGPSCELTPEFLEDPTSCPQVVGRSEYVNLGTGLPDPNQPYQDFLGAFANPTNRDRNDAYLVLPVATQTRTFGDPTQTTMLTDFRSFQWHDKAGNVQFAWDMGAMDSTGGDIAPSDDRMTLTAYAEPQAGASSNLRDRPLYRARQALSAGGVVETLAETWFSYDGIANNNQGGQVTSGNLTTRTDSLIDSVNPATTVSIVLTYDGGTTYGLPRTVCDPFQSGETPHTTTYSYDASNTFLSSVSRGGLTTTLSYDVLSPAPRGLGLVHTRTDPNSEVTAFGYDVFGRHKSRGGPGAVGVVRRTDYNDYFGWSTTLPRRAETISDGVTPIATEVFLDGLGREVRTLRTAKRPDSGAAAVIEETTAYDPRGNVRIVSRPHFCGPGGASCDSAGVTSLIYDARDRLVYLVQPDGVRERRYETRIDPGRSDPERFEVAIDAAGRRRDIRLDGAGLPAQLIEYRIANSFTTGIERTNYLYDGMGRLQLLCDPLASPCSLAGRDVRHTTLLTYDSLGRVTRRDDPDRGQWTYQFRGDGAPLRQTDGNGVTTAFGYDALYGRLRTVDWSANGSADVTYTYGDELGTSAPANSRGRLDRRAGPTSTLELAYDTSGRVSQRKTSVGSAVEEYTESFTYDWRSRIISHRFPDNETITRSYNVMGLDRIASASRTYVGRIDFNADLNPTQYAFGNGEARTRGYQPSTGYLDSIYDAKAGQPAVLHRSYSYDASGLLGSVTDHLAASETLSNLSYDGLGRLVTASRGGAQVLSNAYDAIGNLTDKEGTAIPFLNAAKPHAPATNVDPAQSLYQYDGAGNLTVREGRSLGYDALNRLTSVSGALPISFGYDDSTERVTKQVGSDRSVFLGPDVEIMNRVRLVKTIRANGEIVARVETLLAAGSGASAGGLVRRFANRSRPVPDELVALAVLLALAGVAGALQREGSAGAPVRAVASSLALLVAVLPVLPRLARAAIKGDVTDDNRVDVGDLLLLLRHVNDGVVLPVDPSVGDVAPWSSGALGDGARNTADLLVLTRGISEPDLDGDGLSPQLEARVGTSPLVADSDGDGTPDDQEDFDQDGLSNASEFLAGSDPAGADSDGDGIVDSRDARPGGFDGERAVWVHTDHLGSVSALSDESGAVVRRITYGVWGTLRSNVPVPGTASLDSAEKYTGQRYDEETSLYYYGARYYDPGLGRFIGADAVIASQYRTSALHPYAYVESNPVNYVDPSGNLAVPGVGGGGAGWNRPDRGGGADIAAGLAGLLQGAIDRTIAQFSAGPEVAPAGPERSVQPGQGFQAGVEYPADYVGPLGPNDQRSPVPTAPSGVDVRSNIEEAANHPLNVLGLPTSGAQQGPVGLQAAWRAIPELRQLQLWRGRPGAGLAREVLTS